MTTNTTAPTAPFTYGPMAEMIAEDFIRRGFVSMIEVDDVPENGYSVTFADRAEAYSAARTITNAFEGDPEAGNPTIVVQPCARGFQTIVIIAR